MAIAVAGDITESIGAATIGKSSRIASMRQARLTSSMPRVRREGTMAISSKENALEARRLRPMSYMAFQPP